MNDGAKDVRKFYVHQSIEFDFLYNNHGKTIYIYINIGDYQGSRVYKIRFLANQIVMVTDRIMEKKNVQLRQAAPASDFSIIGFFPI